ncbi:nucleotidyltransferase [Hansschlegelia plantiphila]|uniref:Nucleotidyltransferase n=2 Tax=Hansschlegelia plantiphila TaxID=374655 RepID=A0A9W6IY43_9HYPH|nr:nucleotidyltransferase [Hansschlegelia plantiphila]
MTMSREFLVRSLSALEPALQAEGVTHLALFGSRARADHRPDSDVDVVIDVRPGHRFSLLDLIGVAHEIEGRTGLPANVFMRRSLNSNFSKTLAEDEIKIF